MDFNALEFFAQVAQFFVPFLFALCFHEFAHAYVARLKGDRTAELMGRLTMNPFAHADPIGTFVLPMASLVTGWALFGWAKPVPVNARNLKNPKEDMFWIALAGPLSNILLAIVGAFFLVFSHRFLTESVTTTSIEKILLSFVTVNVLLAIFNMIPLHPLDGGKVLARFLPDKWDRWLEDNQAMMSMALLVFFVAGGFTFLAGPLRWISVTIIVSVEQLFSLIS